MLKSLEQNCISHRADKQATLLHLKLRQTTQNMTNDAYQIFSYPWSRTFLTIDELEIMQV